MINIYGSLKKLIGINVSFQKRKTMEQEDYLRLFMNGSTHAEEMFVGD